MADLFRCPMEACFGNTGFFCTVLREPCKKQPCPFYKAINEVQKQDMKYYGKIIHVKREQPMGE